MHAFVATGSERTFVFAMRGTRIQDGGDWLANVQQALGANAAHYREALGLAGSISESGFANRVSFTGHSLGGGLASAAAIASGRPADTFNAAGLHGATVAKAESIRTENGVNTQARIVAHYVKGEILSRVQDGSFGVAFQDLPSAFGIRRALDPIAPVGTSWVNKTVSPVASHSIDWVLSSLPR